MTHTAGRIMPYDPEYERQLVEMKRKLQTYDALKEERDELLSEQGTLKAQNKAMLEALEYLVGECDEDMDDDYNPHAAPLAKARAAIKAAKP